MLSRRGASQAGRLRNRLVLEKPTTTADGAGGGATSWTAAASLFADIVPLAAGEAVQGAGIVDRTTHRIVVRHRGDVAAGDRFRLGARIFAVRGVHDPHEDGRWLVCLAAEEGGAS